MLKKQKVEGKKKFLKRSAYHFELKENNKPSIEACFIF